MSDPGDFSLSRIKCNSVQRPTKGDRGVNPDRPRQDYSSFGYEDAYSRSPTCSTLAKINRTTMSYYLVHRVCEDPMLRELGLNLDLESGRVLGY